MVMKQRAVVGLASDHFQAWRASTNKAKMLDAWARGNNENPRMPATAQGNEEYQALSDFSATPWAHLVISSAAQTLSVIDQRKTSSGESTRTFTETWRPNSMLSRQRAIYRGALGHNLAYASTLPGKRPHTDAPMPIVRGVSATKMAAFYDDEAADDFARFAMWGELQHPKGADPFMAIRIYDETHTYFLACNEHGDRMHYLDRRRHDVGVTPIHRFAPRLDLDGYAIGEIEPFLPLLHRLDQDVFDRLIVQRFNSWKVRYVAGMTKPRTPEERRAASLALRVEDLLVSESKDTKFGTLDSTDIKQYIEAHDADVRDLAATSQTPPHHLLGQMANLSAEALESAEKSLMRKVQEYRDSFAQSWDSVMRSCAFIMSQIGSPADRAAYEQEAIDYEMAIKWKESDDRALAPVADALSKLADSLGVPYEMLWEQIPFWKKGDTERAKELLADQENAALLGRFLDAAAGSGNTEEEGEGGGPAD